MIILLSPAKTFHKDNYPYQSEPQFSDESKELINRLKKLSPTELQSKMKLSNALLNDVNDYINRFGTHQRAAIFSYAGHAFKALDVFSMSDIDITYLKTHLYVLSGLYGILRPFDGISLYRLEMNFKGIGNLYTFWSKIVNDYLVQQHHDELIIDLASAEYSQLLNQTKNSYHIKFYQRINGELKAISMHVKHMRGLMARHLIQTQISSIELLKQVKLEGYSFHEESSTPYELIFIKED